MTGFHTFFHLPDILPCHLNRCYSEPIACGLFTSSFQHLSKSRQANRQAKERIRGHHSNNDRKIAPSCSSVESQTPFSPVSSPALLARAQQCHPQSRVSSCSGPAQLPLHFLLAAFLQDFCGSEAYYRTIQEVAFLL